MSCWTNGSYIPHGMDFGEWVEYLDALIDSRHEYEEDPELKEFMEYELENPEKDFDFTLNEKDMEKVRNRVDSVMLGINKFLADKPKSEQLEILSDYHEQCHTRLLFDYIKKNKYTEAGLIFLNEPESFLEEEQKARTFTNISKILNTESFDPENQDLMKALNSYEKVLQTAPWAKKHSDLIEQWINSKAGDKSTVCTKLLDAKVQVLKDEIQNQPEQIKKKPRKRDYDMER